MIDQRRIRNLNNQKLTNSGRSVIYWMSRDQRVKDNWALIYALEIAIINKTSLNVVFIFNPNKNSLNNRNLSFMFSGLEKIYAELKKLNIGFILKKGDPKSEFHKIMKHHHPIAIVSDFSPLKYSQKVKSELAKKTSSPFFEVDAHNIIPCWILSNKQEFSARTIRPKINRTIDQFLTEIPQVNKHIYGKPIYDTDFKKVYEPKNYESLPKVSWIESGEEHAHRMLIEFLETKLSQYSFKKNNPNEQYLSNLSPYIHFGQISAQRIVIETKKKRKVNSESFLEEIIVRKELSDNYCFYNNNYDSIKGIPNWAKKELSKHIDDKREYIYQIEDLELAKTHDELWNASQLEMVKTGKMHGYMRMYWAKKILEWSVNPEKAVKHAIYLNDKYEIDGRDPNGYVGILWAIGGLHDRPFFDRKIIGKIRPMTKNGLEKKFDVNSYINYVSQLP